MFEGVAHEGVRRLGAETSSTVRLRDRVTQLQAADSAVPGGAQRDPAQGAATVPVDDVEPAVGVADGTGGRGEVQASRLDVHVQISPHSAQRIVSAPVYGAVRAGVATVALRWLPYCPA
ncbi:hypothetical protein AXK59_12045 [Tsukamurella tyrosinosolvens]|nr:hypothetical protein AXK59_12045 [Tsukamurella tyrosinosolvens]KZL96021.1 hypothetical protein AXX05_23150 [Tsukamurella tyrosinosolvens]